MVNYRDQYGGGPNRLLARYDFQHSVVALIAAARNDIGIDQARRHLEAKARAAPIEKLGRADGSGVRFQHRLVQSAPLTCSAPAIGKNSPPEATPNIG